MTPGKIMGTITFINHDKDYATIEYIQNGKKKTINGNISEKEQLRLKARKIIKKTQGFHLGDEVSFIISPSAKGDKMTAENIEFKFNNALNDLINKSAVENRFVGYLKKAGDDYFVKETGSYILFPLKLSPWEREPGDNALNEPFFFKLENTGKPGKVTAAPFEPLFIPEYMTAMKYFKSKTPVDAVIYKITPYGVFVNVLGDKIRAKLPLSKHKGAVPSTAQWKTGDIIKIIIRYLGSSKIIIESK